MLEAEALIFGDAVDLSLIGHAVVVLVFALALAYILMPANMGSRRLRFASGVTVVAHLADATMMLVRNNRSILTSGKIRVFHEF